MKKLFFLSSVSLISLILLSFSTLTDWFQLDSEHYSLMFPEKPIKETRYIKSDNGNIPIIAQILQTKDSKNLNCLYGIAEITYPDSTNTGNEKDLKEAFFSKVISGIENQTRGKLISVTSISKDSFPGKELILNIKEQNSVLTIKTYLVNHTMFMLQVILHTASVDNPSKNKFFDSFKIKP